MTDKVIVAGIMTACKIQRQCWQGMASMPFPTQATEFEASGLTGRKVHLPGGPNVILEGTP